MGKIPKIPDLIISDDKDKLVLNLEGKTNSNLKKGIEDIKLFDVVEEEYIKLYYPNYKIIRGVVLFGGDKQQIENREVIFLLNKKGELITSKNTPKIILKALNFNKK